MSLYPKKREEIAINADLKYFLLRNSYLISGLSFLFQRLVGSVKQ